MGTGGRHRGGDVDSGFCRKDGWGVAGPMGTRGYSAIGEATTWVAAFAGKTGGEWRDLWELVGIRPSGRRYGFGLSLERREWWLCLRQLAGLETPGRDVGCGFRRKDRWGVAVSMATGGHTDAGEGTWIPAFAGKTGGAIREAIWVRAFAGKTGVVAVSMATGGPRDTGRGRGFRLLPELNDPASFAGDTGCCIAIVDATII